MATPGKYRGRIVRPIPYEDGSGGRLVAPVGAYDIAEVGEHLQFFGEGFDPSRCRASMRCSTTRSAISRSRTGSPDGG